MKYVLAIDTAFSAINVGVLNTETVEGWSHSVPTERGQAEHLAPLINDVLAEADVTYSQIGLIAVTVGPGSFTGVRVGIAAARGLALVIGCPVVGVTTADAIYATFEKDTELTVLIDSKRNDLFVARYAGVQDVPMPPEKITIESSSGDYIGPLAGDGAQLIGQGDENTVLWPDPLAVAALGLRLFETPGYQGARKAEPLYLREAEVSRTKAIPRVPLNPLL